MIRKLFFRLFILFGFTCCVSQRISNFDEIKKFYHDLKPLSCQEEINNDYWIQKLETHYDRLANDYFLTNIDTLPELPLKDTLMIELESSIKVNYAITIKELKRSNHIKRQNISKCRNYYRNTHISLPIFNQEKTLAVIEDKDGTTFYKKNKEGTWVFHDLGLIRVY